MRPRTGVNLSMAITERTRHLTRIDHDHVWHPFTQMQTWLAEQPLFIERGEGNYLFDSEGRRYLDGVASLWCNVHGHRKPALDRALAGQAAKIAHTTMLGLANVPATELAARLIELAPAGLTRVFYSDSGAEAVEVALRIAAQFCPLVGAPQRRHFVTLTESYHGDTLGSVSLGYSQHFHQHIAPLLFTTLKIDPPHVLRFYRGMTADAAENAALEKARQLFAEHGHEIAALVIEPLIQGAAGMWTHSTEYLRSLAAIARAAGALVIADEVATGFGRTGLMFACEQAGLQPDLLCLGKGLTGGYLPMAATLASERIFNAFLGPPEEYRALYYGHTYTGNPLAAAVALANLDLFREERVIERIAPLIESLRIGLADRFGNHRRTADIRQWGLMAGVELMESPEERRPYPAAQRIGARITAAARHHNVIVRPLGDVLIFMPPLSITATEIEMLLDAVHKATVEIIGT